MVAALGMAVAGLVLGVDAVLAASAPWVAVTVAQVVYLKQSRHDIDEGWSPVRRALPRPDAKEGAAWIRSS